MIYYILGMIGASTLVMSSLPQLIKSFKTKDVSGVSLYSLLCLCVGHALMLICIIGTQGFSMSIFDYSCNTMITFFNIVLYLRYKKT